MKEVIFVDRERLLVELGWAVKAAGSQRAWAQRHGISESYLSDVMNGRREPGASIAEALGYERVPFWRKREDA